MKKFKLILICVVLSVIFASISCKVNVETNDTPEIVFNYPESGKGSLAKNKIAIGDKTYAKTAEVVMVANDTKAVVKITEEPTDYKGKGVFIENRQVTLSPFVMGAYEVTQELYEAVMGSNPSECISTSTSYGKMLDGELQSLRPVDGVTWYNCIAFCNALTKKTMTEADCVYYTNEEETQIYESGTAVYMDLTKKGYRLPTEAEWEFAARGGDPTSEEWKKAYAGVQTEKESGSFSSDGYDKDLNEYAWYWYNLSGEDNETIYSGTAGYGTHEVGKKKPNALGLYDMSGNVWEWCWDKTGSITTEAVTDPLGGSSSSNRVLRGGGWSDSSCDTSVSYRGNTYGKPGYRDDNVGFRLVRSSS